MVNCLLCGKQTKNKKFCSNSCAAKYNNPSSHLKKKKLCEFCGNPVHQRHARYCSNKCHCDDLFKKYIEKWKDGLQDGMNGQYGTSTRIKKYLLQKCGYKCQLCGWGQINPFTNKVPLQLDHIDGDYTNNKQQNLRVLCPNCHALTPTYKGANKGKGRTQRKKYYMQSAE